MLILEVCDRFEKDKIPYALVGGYAVALHGVQRGTVDIDFAVALTPQDLEKVEVALNSLGLQSRLPLKAQEVATFRQEYIEKRNLIAWSFVHPKNPIWVVDLILTEDVRKMKVDKKKMRGHSLKVASVDDLIRMKTTSGRPQDLEDIKLLRQVHS